MTIKELCNKCKQCADCSFVDACDYLDCNEFPEDLNRLRNIEVTKSIIQTAKILESDKRETTNGDMIMSIFPNAEVKEKNNGYEVYFGTGTATQFFNHQWWNTPYGLSQQE